MSSSIGVNPFINFVEDRMRTIYILAALGVAASPAGAAEKPFWMWFSQPVTVTTNHETHVITPDGKAEAKASVSTSAKNSRSTQSASATSGPNGATASAKASGSVSGSGSVSTSSTSSAHAGGL